MSVIFSIVRRMWQLYQSDLATLLLWETPNVSARPDLKESCYNQKLMFIRCGKWLTHSIQYTPRHHRCIADQNPSINLPHVGHVALSDENRSGERNTGLQKQCRQLARRSRRSSNSLVRGAYLAPRSGHVETGVLLVVTHVDQVDSEYHCFKMNYPAMKT